MQRTLAATLVFAAVAIASIAALSWLSFRTVRLALEGEFSRRLEGMASTGASQVSPDDVADACFYIAEQATFMTGQNLTLDGGMTVKMIYEE